MAVSDLVESLGFTRSQKDEDDLLDVPDDARELLDEDDELEEDLPKDPKPARKKSRLRVPEGTVRATPAEKRQVKDALTLLIKMPASVIAIRDPVCGGAARDAADDTIKAMVPLVCRNPTMLRWFTSANAPWLDYLALGSALAPVVTTVWGHHVTHTLGHDDDQGDDRVDLSAYAAPQF